MRWITIWIITLLSLLTKTNPNSNPRTFLKFVELQTEMEEDIDGEQAASPQALAQWQPFVNTVHFPQQATFDLKLADWSENDEENLDYSRDLFD